MKLSDRDIKHQIRSGRIQIIPTPDLEQIRGISIDLRLGNRFRVFNGYATGSIDIAGDRSVISRAIESTMSDEIVLEFDEKFYLHPGELALASTQEVITVPDDLVGWIDGRSSLARLGLMVHATAHRVDPGWSGQIVLEMYNCGKLPLGLSYGTAVCSLCFEQLSSPCETPYNLRSDARYKNQTGPEMSQL